MTYAIQHVGYGLVTDGGEVVTFTSESEAIDYLRNCNELAWLGADWEVIPYDPPKPAQHAHAYDSAELQRIIDRNDPAELLEVVKAYHEEMLGQDEVPSR